MKLYQVKLRRHINEKGNKYKMRKLISKCDSTLGKNYKSSYLCELFNRIA